MALGVNLAAMLWGSSAGFVVVFAVQAGMLAVLCSGESLGGSYDALNQLVFWDPISRLILGWQSGGTFSGRAKVLPAEYGQVLNLSSSLVLLLRMAVAMAALGLVAIQKKDILVSNLETGGV